MKHILAAATACLAAACASAPNTRPTQLANACTTQPAYTDYALGADVTGNAKSRRDANLQCGSGASPFQQARDRELQNVRNTPTEQAMIDDRLARIAGQR